MTTAKTVSLPTAAAAAVAAAEEEEEEEEELGSELIHKKDKVGAACGNSTVQ